jgi:hypothetical protein
MWEKPHNGKKKEPLSTKGLPKVNYSLLVPSQSEKMLIKNETDLSNKYN